MRAFPSRLSLIRFSAAIFLLVAWNNLIAQDTRTATAGAPPVPVILISIDTLRADHLSCYGYRNLKTPAIDELAAKGTLFSQASSQIPVTLPSHLSLFTSTYPFANGIEENGERVPPGLTTLASVLESHGYATAAFIGGYFLAREFGLDQGFGLYDSPFSGHMEGSGAAAALKRPAGEVLADARQWLGSHSSPSAAPFFVFIHLFDLHHPYTEPESFRAQHPASEYDAELAYTDSRLGEFWQFLKDRGLFSRSLIVLTADHGESLGDHGESTHGYFIYQSTLRVPLIIHWPVQGSGADQGTGVRDQGPGSVPVPPVRRSRVDEPAGLIDVVPTILQFLDLAQPPSFQGKSLLDLLAPGASPAPREVYSESLYAHDKFGWAPLRSLRAGDFKYIDAPEPELYSLASDPGEQHNLISDHAAVARALRTRLLDLRKRFAGEGVPAPAEISPEALANLHALGYLGFSTAYAGKDTTGPDPKSRLAEYRLYLHALELSQTGHVSEAVAMFREILEEDNQNLPAHDDLADCYFQVHRLYDAAGELRAALALDPHDVRAEELLGSVWLEAGDKPRARAEFERLLRFAPRDYTAHLGLGLLDADAGHLDDAARDFQAALETRPDSAEAHDRLGETYVKKGDYGAAVREFRKALELSPGLASARASLRRLGTKE
ncbi:MAG TPA: sulfatase-like hydrolase/transferase [Terriglobia bacterium]|nr:sulfatase-like hydrolase/transferase [Terriglobia bacterium]